MSKKDIDPLMITLPYEDTQFHVYQLIRHLVGTRQSYIIIGARRFALKNHPRPHSLDFWIRTNVARYSGTVNATQELVQQLVATGLFKLQDNLICPTSGHRCRGIVLLRTQIQTNNYTVQLDISDFLPEASINKSDLEKLLLEKDVCQNDNDVRPLYSLENGILRYESETLLPSINNNNRQKVLLVFGNPAVHSVVHGMFFFSRTNCYRHQLWYKLAEAGLVKEYKSNERKHLAKREDEARKHRQMIVTGTASTRFLVGMTTFFSLPTRSEAGVSGVEQLFGKAIDKLAIIETQRILSYPFSEDAIFVFTQSSTYEHFCTISPKTKQLYWPMRNTSGVYLKKLL